MGSTTKRIVYIHQDGLVTGSAISLRNMIDSLDKELYKPLVVTPKQGEAIAIWEKAGAEVFVFPFSTFWTSSGPSCFSRENIKQQKALFPNSQLRDFVLLLQPDLIHINDKAALQAGISMRKTGIPIIQHSRSAYAITACKWNKWISPRMIKKYAAHIICISEDEMQGFEKTPNKTIIFNTVEMDKAETARNGKVQIRTELGINEDSIVIGMAEHLNKHKGSKALLDLLYRLFVQEKRNNIKFLLVGEISTTDSITYQQFEGSTQFVLDAFLTTYKLNSLVQKVGYKSNVLDYIAAMDILVVAKEHGVLGRQPMEAQSVGTAVVALNGQSGKSSVIQDGITGLLANSKVEWIRLIISLIDNVDKLNRLQESGIIYAEESFSKRAFYYKLKKIYESLQISG